jgi:hypothetical protein
MACVRTRGHQLNPQVVSLNMFTLLAQIQQLLVKESMQLA